ncbi:GNAT family N-acetyltransferase [Paenibacillus sp. NFR01]|uniref:GNAT family N-acetyltransferase n=1 Tax=Paenibacillus sp. NFR01 TaxID=1566279 RepID=UPI0008B7C0F1|nr:GNAT family N-acetyltransferase [Paenibacillus sp. NFR01]SET46993.1 Protein N-acetyltransferase, RimJ/RimL family [Paenibacillus sp. NFR01]
MFIQNNELTIRNATPEDAALLCGWWNDGAVMAHAGYPDGIGTTEEEVIKRLKEDRDDMHRRLITEAEGRPIGEMNYRSVGGGTAEVGIKICEGSMQNQGYGSKLLGMLFRALFSQQGYRKIILDTRLENKRAQHVYEKLGFTKLRVRTENWNGADGGGPVFIDYELVPEHFIDPAANSRF